MKWLAIGIGALSLPVAFLLSRSWMHGSALHEGLGWVLAGILAAQLTALAMRQWRLSLVAPLLAIAIVAADAQWLHPCREGCSVTLQVPAPSR